MSDMMDFPKTVEEFMEMYKMVDTDEVYSNGTEYVPIYRMKQWFEHQRASNAHPTHECVKPTHGCVELISREDALDILDDFQTDIENGVDSYGEHRDRLLSLSEPVGKSDTLEWIPCSERLPKENVPVNITWVNRNPVSYYADIKGIPFTATGVYFEGKWYWWSSIVEDLLAEYGRTQWDRIVELMDESIEVIAWMPLPKPYREDGEV